MKPYCLPKRVAWVVMKYIASISFGKDSLAMLIKFLECGRPVDEVVFFDTGMEFGCIYAMMIRVKKNTRSQENQIHKT